MKTVTFYIALFLTVFSDVVPLNINCVNLCFATSLHSEVRVLAIDGVINPLSARYLKRELDQANKDKVQAVILELNTPGGLESSMREMTQSILNTTIPTIVYITPQGSRAASAGLFITIAAHVAAMAPGTNIGAAHPISIGKGNEQKTDKIMEEKTVNDAAAFARSIAKERGRNITWVEQAVRESISVTAHEALGANIIDLIAADLKELLVKLDRRTIVVSSGMVTLQTRDIQVVKKPMRLPEKILHTITDPNIAYLLITIGFIGIIAELISPGLYFPGITGVISLLLGFTAMGSLPIGWVGLFLLILGIGLLFIETQDPGFGIFGASGLVAFVFGSLMLYTPLSPVSPTLPSVRVNPWIIGGVASGFFLFILFVMKSVISARRLPIATGRSVLVGKLAIAVTDLSPKGIIKLDHERWSAVAKPETETESGIIHVGEVVEVVDLEGAILRVRRSSQDQQLTQSKSKQVRKL
jgi:membrane-bound serine protease (ClpP class)